MVFFIVGCVKRRSTRTTTVLACLSLTTTPWSVRFGILSPLLLLRGLVRGVGLDTGDIATGFTQPRGVLQLPGGALETQIEAFLLQIEDGVVHLVGAHCADIGGLHLGHGHHSAMRATKRVLIGNLAAASDSASLAVCAVTPSISNIR